MRQEGQWEYLMRARERDSRYLKAEADRLAEDDREPYLTPLISTLRAVSGHVQSARPGYHL